MASAATTPNLNLPQWVGTENPERTDFNAAFDAIDAEFWKYIYPVGCLFETTDSAFNPQTHFGGTWEQYGAGRVTVGYSSGETEFNAGGKTGGAKTHAHLVPSDCASFSGVIYLINPENDSNCQISSGSNSRTHALAQGNTTTSTNRYKRTSDNATGLPPYITVFRWRRTA